MTDLAAYLSTLRRLSAVVERLRHPAPRRARKSRRATSSRVVSYLAPAPRVLPPVVAASLEEGLLTDEDAHALADFLARRAA